MIYYMRTEMRQSLVIVLQVIIEFQESVDVLSLNNLHMHSKNVENLGGKISPKYLHGWLSKSHGKFQNLMVNWLWSHSKSLKNMACMCMSKQCVPRSDSLLSSMIKVSFCIHMSHVMRKRVFGGLWLGKTQTSLRSYRSELEFWSFVHRNYRYCTI